ncbi:MAG: CDP-alcohol phosphatidyltransferase family protein [Saprospiraceae bacterium]|nr:CDP-alcohol phosphatidyltransferase family protein [Saprospiraceae bacterium]
MSNNHSLLERWMLQHAIVILAFAAVAFISQIIWIFPAGAALSFSLLFYNARKSFAPSILLSGANLVTGIRLAGVCSLFLPGLSQEMLFGIGLVIVLLDGLDGFLARKMGQESEFGAYLDAETDALLVAALSFLLVLQGMFGWWILIPGFLRYLYFIPVYFCKDPNVGEFRFGLAKYIAVFFMGSLLATLILPYSITLPVLIAASLALFYSFGRGLQHEIPGLFASAGWNLFIFSLFFLIANFLIFIPIYIGHLDIGMYELPDLAAQSGFGPQLAFRSTNDPFRICGEFLLLTFLLYLLRNKKIAFRLVAWVGVWLFIGLILFQTYQAFYIRLYGVVPKMAADIVLFREVLPIFLSSVGGDKLTYFLGGLAAMSVLILIFFLGYYIWLKSIRKLKNRLIIPISLGLLLLFSFWSSWSLSISGKSTFSNTAQWLSPRIVESIRFDNSERLWNMGRQLPYRKYWNYDLAEKPPVYVLFIESYGSVATIPEEAAPGFKRLADSLETALVADDWKIKSTYSHAPILGGRSWLSFTSGLCGVYIDNQIHYNNLLYSNPNYPHWPELMNRLGYDSYRMSTMRTNAKTDSLIPYAILDQFWKFDHFTSFQEIPYKGYPYDFYGGIPDQYALGYFRDSVLVDPDRPHFMFFITMSSHTPWYPPPPVLADWRDLDAIKDSPYGSDRELAGDKMDRYEDAIRYELEVVTQFILDGPDDAIYVLLGDHQPGALEYKLWGIFPDDTTPLHIITKDSLFAASFDTFDAGLYIDTSRAQMIRHEALYSHFMNRFLRRFSTDVQGLPPFQERGLFPPESTAPREEGQ